ncbi:MAG: hypothetical protein IJH91_04865 [Mogibacterium sp.]|nr:hypothetical protein [Mogibacterium sp.]
MSEVCRKGRRKALARRTRALAGWTRAVAAALSVLMICGAGLLGAWQAYAASATGNQLQVWYASFTYTITYNGNNATVAITNATVNANQGDIQNGTACTYRTEIYLGNTLKKKSGNSPSKKLTQGNTYSLPSGALASASIPLTTSNQTVQLRLVNNKSEAYSYANITLGPKRKVTVHYNANGGTVTKAGYSVSNGIIYSGADMLAMTCYYGATDDLHNTTTPGLVRTGYHFEAGREWNANAAGTGRDYDQNVNYSPTVFGGFNGTANKTVTIYANWVPNTYQILFDPGADEAEGAMEAAVMTYDRAAALPANAFVRPGYRFAGWTAGGTGYDDGQTVTNLTAVNGGTVTMTAVWQEISTCQADIVVGKTLTANSSETEFQFVIEAVEGWTHENESSSASGRRIAASEVPMPEGTADGETTKTVTIAGVRQGVPAAMSVGAITYEAPGWYMYRIAEVPGTAAGVRYDATSYYAVVYVEYEDEVSDQIVVKNITAWHNNAGAAGRRPDLTDISAVTDTDGAAAQPNDGPGTFGKVGIGTNSLAAYKFWNDAETGTVRVQKNVTGSLGDRTKEFRFTVRLTGLGAGQTYVIVNDGAVLETGFDGSAEMPDGTATFTSGADGAAELTVRLQDDASFEFGNVPIGATFEVTEAGSDHRASYEVTRGGGTVVASGTAGTSYRPLSTGPQTVDTLDTYTVTFTNEREVAPVTGLPVRAVPVWLAGILAVASAAVMRRRGGTVGEE